MNITDHVFEETKIAGQSRCVADTLTTKKTTLVTNGRASFVARGPSEALCLGRQDLKRLNDVDQ